MRRLVSSTAASQSSSSAPRHHNVMINKQVLQRAHSLGEERSLFPLLAHQIFNQPLQHEALWVILSLTVWFSAEGPWLWVTAGIYSNICVPSHSLIPLFLLWIEITRLILGNIKARDECSWANILFFVLMFWKKNQKNLLIFLRKNTSLISWW